MSINFVIWQFVRIMVCLEQQTGTADAPRKGAVLSAWGEIWQELDARLAELGQSDPAAYADLMMEQEVIIDDISAAQIDEVVGAIGLASKDLSAELAKIKRSIGAQSNDESSADESESDKKELLENLEYEIGELKSLKDDLKRRLRSSGGGTFH